MQPAPWGRWPAWLPAFALALAWVAAAMPRVDFLLVNVDHGNQLAKATQIGLGRHPFVDFHNGVYGPLVFYSSWLAHVLAGGRVLGELVLLLVGYAGAYTLLFVVLWRVVTRRWLAWALLALALVLLPRAYKYYIVLGPMVFVAVLHASARLPLGPRTIALLALAIDVVALYRLDFGVYALTSTVVYVALADGARPAGERGALLLRLVGWCLLFAAPWLVLLALGGNVVEMARISIATARGVATGLERALPAFHPPDGLGSSTNRFVLAFWMLRLAPLVALAWLVAGGRRLDRRARVFGVALALFAALVFLQASHRIDRPHLLQVLPVQLVLLVWLAASVVARWPRRRALLPIACAVVAIPGLLLVEEPKVVATARKAGVPATLGAVGRKLAAYTTTPAALRSADRWKPGTLHAAFAEVATLVHDRTSPETGVLFLPYTPQLYYLAERGFTASFGWLNPGRFPHGADEDAFIGSLAGTRVVADWAAFRFDGLPARNARAYAPRLMRHLYGHYAIVRRIGPTYVLTNDPALLARRGGFPSAYARVASPVLPAAGAPPPAVVAAVNTLAARPGATARAVRGGALVVALQAEHAGMIGGALGRLSAALARDGETFAPEPPGAALALTSSGGALALESVATTHDVPPGTYDLVVLERGSRRGQPVAHPTGTRVTLAELPRG